MFRAALIAFLLALLSALVGCGADEVDSTEWPVEEPGGMAEEGECSTDDECGDGSYCHEPSDCLAPQYCAEGMPPYSAAPPRIACSCDGEVISVGAGYPGRHAWQIDFVTFEEVGTQCDAQAEFPLEFTLTYQLPEDRPEGLLARRARDNSDLRMVSDDGVVQFEAVPGSGSSIDFLLDEDGDGQCSLNERVYLGNAEERQYDLVEFSLFATLRLEEVDCQFW